jgi:DNA-binding Xre family transcriptional regulator
MSKKLKNRLLILIHEKERREDRRVRQSEIAKAIGVTNHTIGNWIRNDVTKFEAHVIEGLCAYFDCQVGDLLYLEETDS